jgi:hypothetical protein
MIFKFSLRYIAGVRKKQTPNPQAKGKQVHIDQIGQ